PARHPAQPARRWIGLELRTSAIGTPQFIDGDLRPASPDRDILDGPDAEALARFLKDAVADADVGPVFLVQSFETSGNVYAVADDRIAHPLLGTDIADQHRIAVDADPDVQRLVPLLHPALVQQGHALFDPQGRDAGSPSMILEQGRRAPEGHHAVADEFVDRAGLVIDHFGDE